MRGLFYAVNSIGVGHLSRTIGIAEQMVMQRPDFTPLFVSEVSDVRFLKFHSLPYFNLPSLHAIQEDKEWASIRERAVSAWEKVAFSVIDEFVPEIVIYDTLVWPFVAQCARKHNPIEIFILRRKENLDAFTKEYEGIFAEVDLVVFPHTRSELKDLRIPKSIANKIYFSGPLIRRDVSSINLPFIRNKYALDENNFIVTITNGGGNTFFGNKDMFIEEVLTAFQRIDKQLPSYTILLFPGPLFSNSYPDQKFKNGRLIVRDYEPCFIDLLAASNLVICRGGYNTINEVIASGVPALCVPASRKSESQEIRILQASKMCQKLKLVKLNSGDIAKNVLQIANSSWWKFRKPKIDSCLLNKKALAERIFQLAEGNGTI